MYGSTEYFVVLGDRNTANFDEYAELENIDRSAEQQLSNNFKL